MTWGFPTTPNGNGGVPVPSTIAEWSKVALASDAASAAWHTARAADTGTVLFVIPTVSGLNTIVGSSDVNFAASGLTRRVVRSGTVDVGHYAFDGWTDPSPATQVVNLKGDMVLRVGVINIANPTGPETLYSWGESGESEATNFTSLLTYNGSQIRSFHEHSAGKNVEVLWNFSPFNSGVIWISLVRVDIGGGDVELRLFVGADGQDLVQLTVASVTSETGGGTNNGTFATVPGPSGGTVGDCSFASPTPSREQGVTFIQILDTTTTLAAEQAVFDGLVGDGT